MAATYQFLPLSLRDIFSELVTIVSDNLSSEATLDVDQVSFKCETWIELIKRVGAEDNSETHRATKYPLVALIRNFDEKYDGDSEYSEVSLTIVIVTLSDPNALSEDREADNYVPILRPIYAELMEQIKEDSRFFGYYRHYAPHTKTESFQLGTDSPQGNKAYLLPDCVDAIIISDLQLKVRPDMCSNTVTGATTAVTYLNNVSELNITTTLDSFTVVFTSAQYTDTLDIAPQSPVYTIVTPHDGGSQSASVSGSYVFGDFSPDQEGVHAGYIQCNDGLTISKLYFFYRILGERVRGCSELSKFVLQNFTTAGTQYTDYPFDVASRWKTTPSSLIRSQSISIDGGNEMWLELYQPITKDTGADTTTISESLASGVRDVVNTIIFDTDTTLENISYYKQQ